MKSLIASTPRPSFRRPGPLVAVLVAWLGLCQAATAATRTWDGSYSPYWSAPQNWAEAVAPTDGDDLVFPAGAANLVNTNNMGTRTYRSISISGSGYVLWGSAIGLTNGLDTTYATGSSTIALDLILSASQSFDCSYAGTDVYVTGTIDLGSHTLTMSGAGGVRLGGVISGTGGLTKTGSGTHWLYGGSMNTYSGATLVNSGTLMLAKSSGNAILYGSLTVGDGLGGASSTFVREQGDFQIGNIPVTINSDGWLDVDDYDDTVGSVSFNGGMASSVIGTLTLGGNVTVSSSGGTISGQLGLGSSTRLFDVAAAGNLTVNASISGTGGITKTNSGFLTLGSPNSYSGVTTIRGGYVEVHDDAGLGATNGGTVLYNGTLRLVGVTVSGESLDASGGMLQGIFVSNAWTGPIALSGSILVDVPNAGEYLNLAGVLSGTGGFTKIGPGTMTLSGSSPNSYSGATLVNNGVLELSKSGLVEAIYAGSLTIGDGIGGANADVVRELYPHQIGSVPVRINDTGLLDLNGYQDYLSTLTLDGGRIVTGSGLVALTEDVTVLANSNRVARLEGRVWLPETRGFDVTDSGYYPDLYVYSSVEGGGGILKGGTGSMALMSSNSYSGLTVVGQGQLAAYHSYALGATASGTVVSNGAALFVTDDSHVPAESLRISGYGSGFGAVQTFSGTNSWAGEVTLEGETDIRVADVDDSLELSGRVTGTGDLNKSGAGVLILSGSSANNHAGNTRVSNGTLELAKTAGTAIPMTLYVGTSSGAEHSAIARNRGSAQSDYVVVEASGLYDLNGFSETLGSLVLNGGGDVQTGAGVLTLNPTSALTVNPGTVTNASASISGFLNVGTGQRVLTVPNGVASGGNPSDLVIGAYVSGSAEIIKEGNGELELTAANNFTGPFTINAGGVRLADAQGLGTTAAGTTVNNSSYLQLHNGDIAVGVEPLTLNSTYQGWGTLYAPAGTNSWAGPITLQSSAWIGVGVTNGLLELSGLIQGPGGLTKANKGAVLMSGVYSNSYGGTTYVREGLLRLNKIAGNGAIPGPLVIGDGAGGAEADVVRVERMNQIANLAPVTINSSGLLQINNGLGDAIGSLTGNGNVDLALAILYTGGDNTGTTFAGVIRGGDTCALQKDGSGTFVLTGNNTYSGYTYVMDGTLTVEGSQPAGTVSVSSSGTLAGSGTIGNLASVGNVMPGSSPGILTCSNMNLLGGTDFYVELNGPDPGTGYDQVKVRGTNNLSSPFPHFTLGYLPAIGDSFVIIDNDGTDAGTGTFSGLGEGDSLSVGNATLSITYAGGTGNDVVLTVDKVTELEPLRFTSVELASTNVVLTWVGGVPLYVVEKKTGLADPAWQPVTPPMRGMQTNFPKETPGAFYRVRGWE